MNYKDINSYPFNQLPKPLDADDYINFANFDGINLSDCGDAFISGSNFLDLGNIDLQTYNSPFQDGGGVLSSFMTEKIIEFTIFVNKETNQDLYDWIDEIKRNTNKQEKKLKIRVGSYLRYCFVTISDIKINYDGKKPNLLNNVVLTFLSKTPHLISSNPVFFTESVVGNTHYLDLTNYGSEESFYNFALICNTGTNITEVRVIKDGYTLTISTNLTVGDVLEIDGENKTVEKNTTGIDYDGIFTELGIGSNPMRIEIDGTVNCSLATYFLIKYR